MSDITCQTCGAINPAENRFCGQCGLPASSEAFHDDDTSQTPLGRRYISALFCDVVSSTNLVRHLDPEQVERIMQRYQTSCAQVVADFGGKVVEELGDGIVALFTGKENSTESAVRAGDELINSINELRSFESTNGTLKLEIRVGIASGEALVKHATDQKSQSILGQPPYLAARLQSLATEGQVLICPETYSKTKGLFEFSAYPQDQLKLKGFDDITDVWRVKGANASQIRFDASKRIKLTPLVGRGETMDALLNRWELTTQKHGQVAVIKGPAGIGKSRVLAEFQQRVRRQSQDMLVLRYQCSNFAKGSPLYPVMQQISRAIQVKKQDTPDVITDKLNGLLDSWGVSRDIFNPILLPLVLDTHRRDSERDLSPREIDYAIRACVQLPQMFTRRAPVLVIIEDMHWADAASKRLLEASVKGLEKKSLMVVVTYRTEGVEIPEFDQPFVTDFALKRLPARKSSELLDSLYTGATLSDEQKQDILNKSEGVPLVLEELTLNAMRHATSDDNTHLQTPSTLFDLFIERYDGFSKDVKALAKLAAVVGQEFDLDIIAKILELSTKQADNIIQTLIEEEQVFQVDQDASWYQFKHALIRDAIYDNTLNQDKYHLHTAVFDYLNSLNEITSTIAIRRIAHHQKMMGFYAPFKQDD